MKIITGTMLAIMMLPLIAQAKDYTPAKTFCSDGKFFYFNETRSCEFIARVSGPKSLHEKRKKEARLKRRSFRSYRSHQAKPSYYGIYHSYSRASRSNLDHDVQETAKILDGECFVSTEYANDMKCTAIKSDAELLQAILDAGFRINRRTRLPVNERLQTFLTKKNLRYPRQSAAEKRVEAIESAEGESREAALEDADGTI